jgi:hypothetical protein
MKAKQIFLKAYKIIKDPAKWTKNAPARTKTGELVLASDKEAVCWCSTGALLKAANDKLDSEYDIVMQAMNNTLPVKKCGRLKYTMSLISFNDKNSHRMVVKFWEKVGKIYGWL